MLAATTTIVVATGVVNMWADNAHAIAAVQRRIEAQFPDRFLLGVGIGHPESTAEYHSPYRTMVEYLDVLDAEQVPADKRALAALGPRALRLAADRTLGAHPYLTTPQHTREARELLGDGAAGAGAEAGRARRPAGGPNSRSAHRRGSRTWS